jgi:hypothetical protein
MNRITNAIARNMSFSILYEGIREMPTQASDSGYDFDIASLAGAFFVSCYIII